MRSAQVLLLLALLLAAVPAPVSNHHQGRLVWIPLDSRPVNTSEVLLFGEVAGLQVLLPPSDRLDWSASAPSDFAGLLAWLKATSRKGDLPVIYTNNLLAGGLIASRNVTMYAGVAERLAALRGALNELPAGPRIAVHILPRILPTQFRADGSPHPDYQWHEQLAERSELIHRLAQADNAADRARLNQIERALPKAAQGRYDQLIQANRQVAEALLDWTAEGLISYLVLGLDDARPHGMANLLQEQLQSQAVKLGIGDRVLTHLGADEIGFLLIAREALQRAGVTPSLWVHYGQVRAPELLLPYEGGSLQASVDQKLALLGAHLQPDGAQQLFVHTAPARQAPRTAAETIQRIAQARSRGQSITLVDITSPGERDHDFLIALRQQVPLAGVNYAGWNTASNALGTGLAMAALTDLHRQVGSTGRRTLAMESFRALRLGYDWVYQARKPALARWAVQNEIDPHQFGDAGALMAARLEQTVVPEVHALLVDLLGSMQVEAGGRRYALCVGRPRLSFPWDRTFEASLQPVLYLVEPHRQMKDPACLSRSRE